MKHNFDEVVDRYNTYCTQWDYIQDRFGKANILPFSISDTDFKIPVEVYTQLQKALEQQIYGYTRWNHHAFKSAITNYFQRRLHCTVQEDWIAYSPSVIYSLKVLLDILSKPKDGVFVLKPMYDAFFHVIEDNDRKLITSSLTCHNDKYEMDFVDMENKIKNAKVFLLCSPHNPTGKVFTKEELTKIVSLCKKYQIPIISDEIHMDVIMPNHTHHSMLSFLDTYEDIYVLSSGSKTFNFPSLIGSYACISNKEVYERFVHRTRHQDFVNSASLLGIHATMSAYNECDYYVEELVQYIYENFTYVKNFLEEHLPDIHFIMPQATYLAWIDCTNVPFSQDAIQEALIHVGEVGIMRGEVYGQDKYLRLNCGCPRSKLEEGMQRVKKAMDSLYQK